MALKLLEKDRIKWKYFGEGVFVKAGDQWLSNVNTWTWHETENVGKKSEAEMIYRRQIKPKT